MTGIENTSSVRKYKVGHIIVKVIGLICFVFFIFITIVTIIGWKPENLFPTIMFFLLSMYGLYLLICTGNTEMDKNEIVHTSKLGKYLIKWDEIDHIETDKLNSIVFFGDNKRVVIPAVPSWSGKDKKAMVDFMYARIKEKGIEIKISALAAYMWSKNSKIRTK